MHTVTLTAPTISNNQASFSGGGVFVNTNSTVTITGGSITGNQVTANGTGGGGIYNAGALTVSAITVSASIATGMSYGGGIFNETTGSLTTGASTMIGGPAPTDANTAYFGGGVYNAGIWNTQVGLTVSNNTATQAGGGIFNRRYTHDKRLARVGESDDGRRWRRRHLQRRQRDDHE